MVVNTYFMLRPSAIPVNLSRFSVEQGTEKTGPPDICLQMVYDFQCKNIACDRQINYFWYYEGSI